VHSDLINLRRLVLGFLASALAALTFHQITIVVMTAAGLIQGNAYSWQPVPP